MAHCVLSFSFAVLLVVGAVVPVLLDKHKRQIYREQLLPRSGGKIPEGAFRIDRLLLNKLNKEGIAVPDGVLLDTRKHKSSHSASDDPEDEVAVIKIVQTPDGRYVPPEGQYHYDNPQTIDSTYLIRPPIGSFIHDHPAPVHYVIPVKATPMSPYLSGYPVGFTLGFSYFGHGGVFNRFQQTLPYYAPRALNYEPAFGGFYPPQHHVSYPERYRAVRQLPVPVVKEVAEAINANTALNEVIIRGTEGKDYPSYTTIPKTSFSCNETDSKQRMFADREAKCQVFHICDKEGKHDSFLCPKGTMFSQSMGHCDWWYNVKCG